MNKFALLLALAAFLICAVGGCDKSADTTTSNATTADTNNVSTNH